MKQGALIFDERSDRYDIRFDLADYYGGLHCGETFDVMVGGRWKPTPIEDGAHRVLGGPPPPPPPPRGGGVKEETPTAAPPPPFPPPPPGGGPP